MIPYFSYCLPLSQEPTFCSGLTISDSVGVSPALAIFDRISPGGSCVWSAPAISDAFSEYQITTSNVSEGLQDPSQIFFGLNGSSTQPPGGEFDPYIIYRGSGTSVDIAGPMM